jgi:hypothetical protein
MQRARKPRSGRMLTASPLVSSILLRFLGELLNFIQVHRHPTSSLISSTWPLPLATTVYKRQYKRLMIWARSKMRYEGTSTTSQQTIPGWV